VWHHLADPFGRTQSLSDRRLEEGRAEDGAAAICFVRWAGATAQDRREVGAGAGHKEQSTAETVAEQ
jgi:hypothetical protein